MEINNFEQIKG